MIILYWNIIIPNKMELLQGEGIVFKKSRFDQSEDCQILGQRVLNGNV